MKTKTLLAILSFLIASLAHASPVTTDDIEAPQGLIIKNRALTITVPSTYSTASDTMTLNATTQSITNKTFDKSSNVHKEYTGLWDFSASGGEPGSYATGITIPANAYIVKAIVDCITAPSTSTGSPTVAIGSQAAGDILAATTYSNLSAGLSIAKEGSGSTLANQIASALKVTASSAVNLVIGSTKLSTGKIRVFLETIEE